MAKVGSQLSHTHTKRTCLAIPSMLTQCWVRNAEYAADDGVGMMKTTIGDYVRQVRYTHICGRPSCFETCVIAT